MPKYSPLEVDTMKAPKKILDISTDEMYNKRMALRKERLRRKQIARIQSSYRSMIETLKIAKKADQNIVLMVQKDNQMAVLESNPKQFSFNHLIDSHIAQQEKAQVASQGALEVSHQNTGDDRNSEKALSTISQAHKMTKK